MTMTFESAIVIILTALGVMLTALAIMIGMAAIWGYRGISDSVTGAATKHVTETMGRLMSAYPPPEQLTAIVARIQTSMDLMELLRKQVLMSVPPKEEVEPASNASVQLPSYPGGPRDVSSPPTDPGGATSDTGPNNS
jgi:hypothetical protein